MELAADHLSAPPRSRLGRAPRCEQQSVDAGVAVAVIHRADAHVSPIADQPDRAPMMAALRRPGPCVDAIQDQPAVPVMHLCPWTWRSLEVPRSPDSRRSKSRPEASGRPRSSAVGVAWALGTGVVGGSRSRCRVRGTRSKQGWCPQVIVPSQTAMSTPRRDGELLVVPARDEPRVDESIGASSRFALADPPRAADVDRVGMDPHTPSNDQA